MMNFIFKKFKKMIARNDNHLMKNVIRYADFLRKIKFY